MRVLHPRGGAPGDAAQAAAMDDTVAAWRRQERKVRSRCYVPNVESKFAHGPRQPVTGEYLVRKLNAVVPPERVRRWKLKPCWFVIAVVWWSGTTEGRGS